MKSAMSQVSEQEDEENTYKKVKDIWNLGVSRRPWKDKSNAEWEREVGSGGWN